MFDIDGTLTTMNEVDGQCFRAAVRAVLPEAEVGPFHGFTECTYTAILRDLWATHPEREYSSVESEVQRHFIAGLEEALESNPNAFLPVPGALKIFEEVRAVGWTPAIATGGWRRSAELKLVAAAIPTEGVPLATSSENARRIDIIRRAVAQATSGAEASEVVYVGDGTWDVKACRELSIGFVGRSTPETETRLVDEGAKAMIPDFSEPSTLTTLLEDPGSLKPSAEITRVNRRPTSP